ncbi:MAG: hypothetical protein H0W97_03980, partial [Actinobacteria bacterium]|nr:hypothetical protein [Actinomycetota bacterium]
MRNRTARRIARSIWGVTLALMLLVGPLIYLNRSTLSAKNGELIFLPAFLLSILVYSTVGALIASRQNRNPIGWALGWIGLGLALDLLASNYAARALVVAPGSLPFGTFAAWLQGWVGVPALSAITPVFLLFPTGSVPSRRWRPVLWLAIGAAAVGTLAWALKPGVINQSLGNVGRLLDENPLGVGHVGGVFDALVVASSIASVVAGAAAIFSIVVRFRRARGDERQQIRWLALVGAAAAMAFIVGLGVGVTVCSGDSSTGPCETFGTIAFTIFFLCLSLGIPIACGIAILKYRLWDLDLVIKKTVVALVLATVIAAIAIVSGLTVGQFALWESTAKPVTALVGIALGLLFVPLLRLSRRISGRVVYGRRATPYEVLTEFSGRVGESYSAVDVLPRMAQVLAQGTGAAQARIWLRIGETMRPAAAWPETRDTDPDPVPVEGDSLPDLGEQAVEVRHQGELLGALSIEMPANDPLDPGRDRLVRDLASQAGFALRNVRLVEEVRASRRRIVTAQDERAKALERNIHDGAQQQLVALSVKLRLAQGLVKKDPDKAENMLGELQTESQDALENLRDLARGIYPPVLADKGLVAALETQARRAAVPITFDVDGVGRYPRDVEAAVYF